jgi:drug/metabolite transporter (DMT)-like permease
VSARAGAKHNLTKGILYMVLATMSFAVADATGKLLTERYPFMQIVWLRSVIGMAFIGLAIAATGRLQLFKTRRIGWHLSRTLVGIILITGIFTGLKYIPLAEVTSIVFANPFIVAILTPLFLKEKVSRHTYFAIIIGFIGILIVARPTPDHFHYAHLFMLGFATATAYLIVTARKLADTEHVLTLNFYLYPGIILFSTYRALTDWQTPDLLAWVLFVAVALSATLALFFVTQAMHNARPAVVAPIDYCRIIWTVSIGYLFWDEFPDPLTWLGIITIIISGIYVVTHGRSLPENGVEQIPARDEKSR